MVENAQKPISKNAELEQRTLEIGELIETRLGVQLASLTDPNDLLICAHAAYLGNNNQFAIRNIDRHARLISENYSDAILANKGTTKEELRSRYPFLIGIDHAGNGEIAKAIRSAGEKLTSEEAEALEIEVATLMAYEIYKSPGIARGSTVFISPDARTITFRGLPFYELESSPHITIEYGPGTSAAQRIHRELITQNEREHTIYIEKGEYIPQLLRTSGKIVGVSQPKLTTRGDGIKSATNEMIAKGGESKVDLIVMSMVHSAGIDELTVGIENGFRLLKPNGILAIQVAHEVDPQEAEGIELISKSQEVFGLPAKKLETKYIQATDGKERPITLAIFVK